MEKILLPSLKITQNTGLIGKEGGWHSLKSTDLIDGIDITLNSEAQFTPFSIPDIYSHFVRFRCDLLETKSEDAHSINAIKEWKQIINIIALNKSRNLGVTLRKIDLSAQERFLMVVSFMKPANNYNLLTKFGWAEIYVLLNDKAAPFALLSPTTLICPAARYRTNIQKNYPIDLNSLSADERTELICWLEHLWYTVNQLEQVTNQCKSTMEEMIRAYLQEVSGKQYPQECPVPDSILMCDKQKSPPIKTIIDFLKCYVFMGVVIDEKPFDKQNIFTPKLSILVGANEMFPGCIGSRQGVGCFEINGSNNEYALLPFSYEFTRALNVKASQSPDFQTGLKKFISEGTTFEKVGDKYIVKINTQLIGGSIIYEYCYGNIVKVDNLKVPNILLWPNAVITDAVGKNCWKCYYTYLEDKIDPSIKIYPLSDFVENMRRDGNSEYIWRVSKSDNMPRFLLVSDSEGTQAGVLAIKDVKRIPKGEGQAYIGVDFGTTNTNVYIKVGDFTEPLKYEENMFLAVTKCDDIMTTANFLPVERDESIVQTIYQDFIFDENVEKNRAAAKQPITEGHIFFPPTKKSMITEEGNFITNLKWGDITAQRAARTFLQQLGLLGTFKALQHNAGNIDFIVSYPSSFDPDRKEDLEKNWTETIKYLRGLLTKININENVSMLTESYAVGIFFSSNKDLAINQTNGYICIDIGGGTSDISIWQGLGATRPIKQLSLELAGQTILTDNIFNGGLNVFEAFFKKWILEEKEEKENNVRKRGVSLAYSLAENSEKREKYLSFSRSLMDRIMSLYGDDIIYTDANLVPEVKTLRRKLMFYLAAIFFSTSILLRKAINDGTFKILDSIDFLVAGNGSKTLKLAYMAGNYNWLNNHSNSVYLSLYGMIADIINADKSKIEIRYSKKPKEEVACGLVESFNFIQNEKDCFEQTLEAFDANDIASEFIDLYIKHFGSDFTALFSSEESAKAAISAKIKQINGLKRFVGKNGIERFAIAIKEISFGK